MGNLFDEMTNPIRWKKELENYEEIYGKFSQKLKSELLNCCHILKKIDTKIVFPFTEFYPATKAFQDFKESINTYLSEELPSELLITLNISAVASDHISYQINPLPNLFNNQPVVTFNKTQSSIDLSNETIAAIEKTLKPLNKNLSKIDLIDIEFPVNLSALMDFKKGMDDGQLYKTITDYIYERGFGNFYMKGKPKEKLNTHRSDVVNLIYTFEGLPF